ncbi:MAG: hypothetical protein ACI8Y7_000911 [Candidatus Woesearchaeota archaeon]|jgi:hypothetical protein
MTDELTSLKKQVRALAKEVSFVKENMVARDEILTEEEVEAYVHSLDSNNLVSSSDVKKQLGL